MESLKEYVEKQEFTKSDIESFPYGKTKIKISETKVEELPTTNPRTGESEVTPIIHYDGKKYWGKKSIDRGIKEMVEKGIDDVEIIKSGQGINTSYSVVEA